MSEPVPTLVFAHYFGGSARAWQPLLAALGSKFPVIAPDLPGFGGSPGFAGGPSIDRHADHFAASAGDRLWVAVGHSMGGKIAMAAATRRPDKLRAMILIAASPPTPEPMAEAARAATIADYGNRAAAEAQCEAMTRDTAPEVRLPAAAIAICVEDRLRVDRSSWMWWLENGSRCDVSGRTSAIKMPTLVLSGDRDTVLDASVALGIAGSLAHAEHIVVAGGGHLMPMELPMIIALHISDFIAKLEV
jgi:pimeloyl-ACP methyl ester carboxylesterase